MYTHSMMTLMIWVFLLLSRSQRPRLVVEDESLSVRATVSKRSSAPALFVIDDALIYFAHFKHSLIIFGWLVATHFQIFVDASFFMLQTLCRSLTILFFVLSFRLLIFLKRAWLPHRVPVLSVALFFTIDTTCVWFSLIHLIWRWPKLSMLTSWIAAILFWAVKESLRLVHMLLLVKSPPRQGINGPVLIFCTFYLLVSRIIRDSWSLDQRCDRNSFLLFSKALDALLHMHSLLGTHITPAIFVKIVIETTLLLLTQCKQQLPLFFLTIAYCFASFLAFFERRSASCCSLCRCRRLRATVEAFLLYADETVRGLPSKDMIDILFGTILLHT